MEEKRITLLKSEKISKAVIKLSIPAMAGLMIMGIYNFVDTMFVSWLGTNATGATQVVLPISLLVSAFGLTFGIGGGSYVSRLMGMDRKKDANKVATVCLYTALIVGLIFTAITLFFMDNLFSFFGATEEMLELTRSYGTYILLGSVFTMGNMTLNNLLRAEGSAMLSTIAMVIGSILNIALDPLFIFTFGLGISGAGMATTLSKMITFGILLSRYLGKHTLIKINPKYFKPKAYLFKEVFKVGIPTFLRQLLFSISLGFLNTAAVNNGGPDLLAATGIIFKVTMIPMYAIYGIGQGFQPVVGFNYGAKSKTRVLGSLRFSLLFSSIVAVISCIIILLFDNQILSVFKPEESVVHYAVIGLRYYGLTMIFMSVTNTVSIFYQALGKGKESLLFSIARQGLFFIPIIFVIPNILGVHGVLISQLLSDILTLVLTLSLFIPYISSNKLSIELNLDKN